MRDHIRFMRKLLGNVPHKKRRYHSYPTELMDYIKGFFLDRNKTGCRFITVDAYKDSVGFYVKNGFDYLTERDVTDDTRLMYFDLKIYDNVTNLK